MVRVFFIFIIYTLTIDADNLFLKNSCLNCHNQEQIPSELIYRRYLMRYSVKKEIKNQMLKYLKNPTKKSSIMPKQFFLKFPIKSKLNLNNQELNRAVDEYIEFFDIKKTLK